MKNIKNKNEKSVCIIILFEMTLTHITSFVKKKNVIFLGICPLLYLNRVKNDSASFLNYSKYSEKEVN